MELITVLHTVTTGSLAGVAAAIVVAALAVAALLAWAVAQ